MTYSKSLDQGHLRRILDTVPCGIYDYYLDAQGVSHFPYVNQQFLELLDISQEELQQDGSIVWSLFHPDDRAMVAEADLIANRAGSLFMVETRIITRKGAVKWLRISSLPTSKNVDGAAVWSGYYLDITDAKNLQAQLLDAQAQLREAAVESARSQERSSLMRDVHDGFGSQLSQALMLLDRQQLSPEGMQQVLQECVTDLYLVVDTFSDEDALLINAFVDYRYRLEKRLSGQPIQFHWTLALASMKPMPPRLILHLLRIVQELVSNSLRHAKPKNIWISAQFDEVEHMLEVNCTDDGAGMPQELRQGRGLRNIHQRVGEMGATISFADNAPGTRVQIRWQCHNVGGF